MTKTGLPVASSAEVRSHLAVLARQHRGPLISTIVLYGGAAAASLGAPWLLGLLIDRVTDTGGITGTIDAIGLAIVGFVTLQAVLSGIAHYVSRRFGETVMSQLREDFIERSLSLPLTTIEKAGTGDLMTRSSRDVSELGMTLQRAAPEVLISLITITLLFGAAAAVNIWLAVIAIATTIPPLWIVGRWYLRRARQAYLLQNAAYGQISEDLAATVEGSRTVEAFQLNNTRTSIAKTGIIGSRVREQRTLQLRSVLFPTLDFSVTLPVAAALIVGGIMYGNDLVTIGQVTAVILYMNQAGEPMFELLAWIDELQTGDAAMGRILGIGKKTSPPIKPTTATAPGPIGAVTVSKVCYAYDDGDDVLHDITIDIAPGERIAIVGPSGAGKSTLGRLIAGIDKPKQGTISVSGRPASDLNLEQLRQDVLLVTQEHHVFEGTLRDNLVLAAPNATDDEVNQALIAVDAWNWASALPEGLDTIVGSGQQKLSPAIAQQLALARLVLADPDILVLDEATSLIDPRAARHLEKHLAAVLQGRTVIAIAHRLHTAHDADRIAVVDNGRIVELGSHDELVASDGQYATLWNTWQGTDVSNE